MAITTEAAVLRAVGEPLSIEAIQIHSPARGEVILEMGAAGICGSDRYVIEGTYPVEPPAVCGHEGAGDAVMVFGIGGVGAAAVMGAALAGAERIVAVDINADKLALACGYGATDVVDASAADVADAVAELTGGWGVDAALLAPDRVRSEHYETAIACLGAGGMVVQVGGTSHGMESIPFSDLVAGRNIRGVVEMG
ncbi:MAG: zinc-binding dehydrogenase [bacterium]|nr:zinc-binding dehydrogenase [bacterium]